MEFDKGMAGVLVVVLSLIASVLLGVVTNIDSEEVTKEVPEYVADITGGFTADRDKSYSEYNPSKNYNGYSNNTITNQYPVSYEPAGYTNNYPISHRLDEATSPTLSSPSDFTSTTTTIGTIRHIGFSYNSVNTTGYLPSEPTIPIYTENHYIGGAMTRGTTASDVSYSKGLASILSECVADGTTVLGVTPSTIQIQIPSIIKSQSEYHMSHYGSISDPYTIFYVTNNIMVVPTNYTPNTVLDQYTYEKLRTLGVDSSFNTTILYSPSDNSCTVSINNVPVYTGNPANYKIIYGMPGAYASVTTDATGWGEENGFSDYFYGYTRTLTNVIAPQLSVDYFAETITDYIDTRYGIGIRNSEEVVWNNDQQNGVTSIAFSVWNETSKQFIDNGSYSDTATIRYYGTDDTDTFTVYRQSGRTYVSLNGNAPVDIGIWTQIQINIDNINGLLTVYPISFWNNFNNYDVGDMSVTVGALKKGTLDTIIWTADNSFRLQVVNTTVFFNTYGVVMIDPHINITDLWPNYSRFMIAFTKMATIGDSITIGNTTFPISEGTITVNGEKISVVDVQLTYEQKNDNEWDIIISSEKVRQKITEPNTYIALNGTWYFSTGFYNIITKTVTERSWNPIYIYDINLIVLFMAGFLVLGGIIIYKLGYADVMSIIIIVASEIILIVIGGAT